MSECSLISELCLYEGTMMAPIALNLLFSFRVNYECWDLIHWEYIHLLSVFYSIFSTFFLYPTNWLTSLLTPWCYFLPSSHSSRTKKPGNTAEWVGLESRTVLICFLNKGRKVFFFVLFFLLFLLWGLFDYLIFWIFFFSWQV